MVALAHPIYLDVEMMMSFLAYYDGGVALGSEETNQAGTTDDRGSRAKGRFSILAALVGSAGLEAELSKTSKEVESAGSKIVRHHTAASLFNALYDRLQDEQETISLAGGRDLAEITEGQLVEASVAYLGNPLEDLLSFADRFFPYIADRQPSGEQIEQLLQSEDSEDGLSEEAVGEIVAALYQASERAQADEGWRIMRQMVQDLRESPVHDIYLRTDDAIEIVATVSADYFTEQTNQFLRAGKFQIIGKVTRVIRSPEYINLARRSVMSVLGPDSTREVIMESVQSAMNESQLDLPNYDPIVSAPALQLLPMAIFV